MKFKWLVILILVCLVVACSGVEETSNHIDELETVAVRVDTSILRDAVTVDGMMAHLEAFQAIADANGNNRFAGFPGHDASAEYVYALLRGAGYHVSYQEFQYLPYEVTSSSFSQTTPSVRDFAAYDFMAGEGDYDVMDYSGSGTVTDAVVQATADVIIPFPATPNTSTSGCETSDFQGFIAGNVALIQRGTCTFLQKAQNAQAAGAVAVLIFNEGQVAFGRDGVVLGTLGEPGVTIPVLGIGYQLGVELYNAAEVRVTISVDAFSETLTTRNVLAETFGGRSDRVVMVGAHLDSVLEGPGIQDNGSGSAAILEIALQMARLGVEPTNKVRFAFWSAEESGLIGSAYYVSQLSKRDIKNIALNLNFDMIASPNYVRFIYDGDGSDTSLAGPNGSKNIEAVFLDYFAAQGLPTKATAFDGRSDYGPFIDVGIPAGGLFTGAEDIKTEAEAAIYGGTAGIAYDPCYHLSCDTLDNINVQALDEMSDAAAHAVLTFAMTTSSVNGTAKASRVTLEAMEYRGSYLQK